MAAKTSPEIRAEILKYWTAGGWSIYALGNHFKISSTTIRMIVNPEYAEKRRNQINANRRAKPPPSEMKRRKNYQAPGLAKV